MSDIKKMKYFIMQSLRLVSAKGRFPTFVQANSLKEKSIFTEQEILRKINVRIFSFRAFKLYRVWLPG